MEGKKAGLELWIAGALVILLVVIAVISTYIHSDKSVTPSNESISNSTAVYCTPADKQAEACVEIYAPVCGWFDPAQIQCIRYPCAQTFGNSCHACGAENVLYWTAGECPTG